MLKIILLLELLMGWAMKVNSKDSITDLAYEEAASYFMSMRSMNPPRRAEPRGFSQSMEEMKNPDGEYKFRVRKIVLPTFTNLYRLRSC